MFFGGGKHSTLRRIKVVAAKAAAKYELVKTNHLPLVGAVFAQVKGDGIPQFDTVVVRADLCKGYFACAGGCPFGVIEGDPEIKIARKCTLCYDRLQNGLIPACAKTCPTDSILFGPLGELIPKAEARVRQLHGQGQTSAYLYGVDKDYAGGLGNFYLLIDEPKVYGLPDKSQL